MPVYCELDDIRDVLTRDAAVDPELQNNGSKLDEENLAAARSNATAEIDAKLALRYQVPFSPVPVLVKSICIDIAAYLVDLNFREDRDMQTELNPVYQRYLRALALLGQLSTGEAVIPPDGSEPENPAGGGVRVAAAYSRPPLISVCDFDIGQPYGLPPYTRAEGWGIH